MRFFAVAWHSRTYLRMLYLLLAFPFGTLYFVLLTWLLVVGLSTVLIAGVGLAVFLLAAICTYGFAVFERRLAVRLLGVTDMPPIRLPAPPPTSRLDRLKRHLSDPVTWKSLVYVLLEFPFGVAAFVVVLTLSVASLAVLLYPLEYVIDNLVFSASPGGHSGLFFPGVYMDRVGGSGEIFPGIYIDGRIHADALAVLLVVSLFGILVVVACLHLFNGLGYAWGRFARLMLAVDPSRLRLIEAEAEATRSAVRADIADRSRRELVVNASHELRTPVASLRGHLDSLLAPNRPIPLDTEAAEYLAIMSDEVSRLSSLVDDVLSLARAEADELRLNIQPVRVEAIVQQVCDTLAPLARRERNLSLVHSSETGLPSALADPERLVQVLSNLVRNAINYTPDSGIISVTTTSTADRVVLTVADTGIGMAPDEVQQIFDRFYRSDQSRSRDSGGSGLGLAIVRELLTAMGADIQVESALGLGSSFRILLRAAET